MPPVDSELVIVLKNDLTRTFVLCHPILLSTCRAHFLDYFHCIMRWRRENNWVMNCVEEFFSLFFLFYSFFFFFHDKNERDGCRAWVVCYWCFREFLGEKANRANIFENDACFVCLPFFSVVLFDTLFD